MFRGHTITLVIPCRNEEKALAKILAHVPRWVDEVIVVDNNSTDKTRQVAAKYGAKVLLEKRHVRGIGYGFAHQQGLKVAKSDIVVTLDGDNTYPLADVQPAVAYFLKNQLDFVSCNRYPLKNREAVSPIRQFGVWVLNQQVRWLYGYPMKDILSGMWVIRRDALTKLTLTEGGWNFSPEIKLAALMNPLFHFSEFHIGHEYRFDGHSKQSIWLTGFEHLFYILKRRLTQDNPFLIAVSQLKRSLKNTRVYLPSFE